MAKFIKFDLTAPGGATGDELLIPVDAVTHIATASTTTTDVFLNFNNASTTKWRITHVAPAVANDVLNAIQDALKANPGGVVSTVGGPIATAQVPARQGGSQGRIAITTKQVNVTYTSAAFTA